MKIFKEKNNMNNFILMNVEYKSKEDNKINIGRIKVSIEDLFLLETNQINVNDLLYKYNNDERDFIVIDIQEEEKMYKLTTLSVLKEDIYTLSKERQEEERDMYIDTLIRKYLGEI